jgi:hypothetical protein
MPTRTQLLITAAIIFIVGSCLPVLIIGDIAIAEWHFGVPVPWLGIDVRYGQSIPHGDFYVRGRIEKIEGLHVYWTALLLSIASSVIFGAILISVEKAVARLAKWLFGKRTESPPTSNA